MYDYSIKVLSWIGISMVIMYRSFFLDSTKGISQKEAHIIYPRRKPYYDISELIRKNIKILTVSIKEDTDFLITWIKKVEQMSIIWKTGETKPSPESIMFQMVSVNGNSSEVAYRIMILPKHTPDKEVCIKRIKGNEEKMTDCDEEENDTLIELISHNKETIIQPIRKDAMTFIKILKGDSKFLDENIRNDIDSLTRTPWLSCRGMCRYYTINLTKTSTECVLQDTDHKRLILYNTIIERIQPNNESPPECILANKETMTEGSLQDKETMTEGSLQDKETMTEGSLQDKETMTEGSLQDKGTMTAHTTHMRELCEPGRPSAIDITPKTIKLIWDQPIVGANWYEIKCVQKHISVVCSYKTSENSCKYIVKGLKRNTEYEFTIQAVKNEVNKGPHSKPLKVSTSVIANYSIAELLNNCFYIIVLIWFTYLLCYIVFIK